MFPLKTQCVTVCVCVLIIEVSSSCCSLWWRFEDVMKFNLCRKNIVSVWSWNHLNFRLFSVVWNLKSSPPRHLLLSYETDCSCSVSVSLDLQLFPLKLVAEVKHSRSSNRFRATLSLYKHSRRQISGVYHCWSFMMEWVLNDIFLSETTWMLKD